MSVRTDVINLNVNINGNKAQADLNNLRKKAGDIRTEMDGLKKGTAEYIAKGKELKAVGAEMDALKKTIGITALNQKELTQELNKLKSLRGSVVPFSKEFNDLSKQIKQVETRLYDVRNGVQGFSSFMSKISDGVKQFGIVAAGYLGFQFITSQFQNIIRGSAKLSDQLADLQRVAGLTASEAENLNTGLKELDTRTTTEGLRNIAIVAGKLGVAKDELLDFTAAVDKLVVSLGDELGDADQITTTLGKILNVFDGKVTGDNITKLGNAFVELANAGVASGGFIADFDQRLSGIAKSAGIGLGELSGLGAGLEELGARVESSSTAVQKLLITIAQDLPAAAKIAGISTEEFSKLYSEDATEALLRYSEGLVKNKTSFAQVTSSLKDAGEEGARTIETISKLGNSSDLLRSKIDLGKKSLTESTAITAAFALKNQTLGAEVDKLGKKFNSLVSNGIVSQFLASVVGGFNKLLDAISKSSSALDDFKKQQKVVQDLTRDILPLVERVDELQKKSALSKDEQIELNKAIQAISTTIPSAITQFDKYGKAIGVSTEKAREFIKIQTLILKEKNREAIKEQETLLKDLDNKAKLYENQLRTRNAAGDLAQTTIRQGEVVLEKQTNEEIAKRQRLLGEVQNRISGVKGILAELKGDKFAEDINAAIATTTTTTGAPPPGPTGKPTKKDSSAADTFNKLKEEAEKYYKEIQDLKKRTEAGDSPGAAEIEAAKQKYDKLLAKAKEYFVKNAIDKKRFNEEEQIIEEAQRKEINDIFQKFYNQRMEEQAGKEYEESLLARKEYADDLKIAVAQEYADGKVSKKQYEAELKSIERDESEDRIIIAQDYSSSVKKAAADVYRFRKEQEKLTTQDALEEAEKRKQSADAEKLAALGRAVLTSRVGSSDRNKAEQDLIIERYRQELEQFDEYSEQYKEKYAELQDELKSMDEEYNRQKLEKILMYVGFFVSALSSLNTIITNRENAAFNKEKALNDKKRKEFKNLLDNKLISQQQYDKKVAELQEQQDARERELKRKQAKREKAINLISAIVNTASAVVEALPNIPLSIAVGALGLLQIGAIATAPLPELGKGDWIRDGDKHSDASGGQLAKIERDEAVISAAAMTDPNSYTISGTPAQITSRLNSQAGGVSWAGGAIVQKADWMRRSPSRIAADAPAIMAMGGTNFGRQQNKNGNGADDVLMQVVAQVNNIAQAVARIPTEIKGKWVIKDLDETRETFEAAKRASSIKQ